MWRAARGISFLRPLLEAADRTWWASVIRRANVVDLEYAAMQGGFRSRRAAIRAYVRTGFRAGLNLNPLFMEQLVSGQLSDAGRVPALYAYLVNDPRAVRTSINWDGPAYLARHPESISSAGGPLGHAWRAARDTGAIELGTSDAVTSIPWRSFRAQVMAPAGAPTLAESGSKRPGPPDAAYLFRVASDEDDLADALATAVEVSQRSRCPVVIAVAGTDSPTWTNVRLLTLWLEDVFVTTERKEALQEVEKLVTPGGVVAVRGTHAEISPQDLLELAQRAVNGPVAPLWLARDGTIAAAGTVFNSGRSFRLLAGHPPEDALALGTSLSVPEIAGETYAYPVTPQPAHAPHTALGIHYRGRSEPPPPVTRGSSADTDLDALIASAGLRVTAWTASGPRLARTQRPSLPDDSTAPTSLRWAIKTAAPAGRRGEWWGDTHFARGIAGALRRLGQKVVIDSYDARMRTSRHLDDVVLALRGPEPIAAQPGARSILWIISHPDEIDDRQMADFDVVFAGSRMWAEGASARFGRPVLPLLQCTDPVRFHPTGVSRSRRVVFVGTARGIPRPSVLEPIRAGFPLAVYGPDWRGWIPADNIVATGIPNAELPLLYETAGAVMNDHWPAMKAAGFVSNRLYDVVASGGRAISDDVEGVSEIFEGAVRVYRSIPQLLDMLHSDIDSLFPEAADLAAVSARVRERDSFDARARTLLDAALSGSSGSGG